MGEVRGTEANNEKALELQVLSSVTNVSSNASSRRFIQGAVEVASAGQEARKVGSPSPETENPKLVSRNLLLFLI